MRTLLLPLCFPALASLADAQCTPAWQPGLQSNGLAGRGQALASFDDGSGSRLAVGGFFAAAGAVAARNVAALESGGWSALGAGFGAPDFNEEVRALLVHDDGSGRKLYAGGAFTQSGAASALHVARWDGAQWSQVGAGLSMEVHALATFDDGTGPALYAAGITQPGGTGAILARWNGLAWTVLDQTLNSALHALEVYDDGSGPALYAAGYVDVGGGVYDGILRWNGSGWSRLGGGLAGQFGGAFALDVYDDGTGDALYVAGEFQNAGATPAARIARWNGTSWSALGSGLGLGSYPRALVHFDDGTGEQLFVAGELQLAGGVAVSNIASWDGTSWSSPGSGINYRVHALVSHDDGSGAALFATGEFWAAGGVPAFGIARWDGTLWSNPDPTPNQGAGYSVTALAAHDDGSGPALYVAGTARGEPARFDGTAWTGLAGGVDGQVFALASFDDGSGPALFAGGLFQNAGGQATSNVARWDGTSWWPFLPGLDNTVVCFHVHDDGSGPALYASGAFTHADGVPALRVARFNGTGWSPVGTGGPGGVFVNSLASFDDGSGMKLWAQTTISSGTYRLDGATWTNVGPGLNSSDSVLCVFDDGHGPRLYLGGNSTSRVQRWSSFSGWEPIGVGFSGSIQMLAVFDDGTGSALYAGGYTDSAHWRTANLARWDGQSWSDLGASITGDGPWIRALAVAQVGANATPSLYVGGFFGSAGAFGSASLAEWRGCGGLGTPACLGDSPSSGCPCANLGAWRHGCANSAAGSGARLAAHGATQPDTVVLESAGEPATALSIVLQATLLGAPVSFGDGVRCVGGVLKRLYTRNAAGGTLVAPLPGELAITARSAALGDPIAPGSTRAYQVYFRDANASFCPAPAGSTWNVSSGLRIDW